MIRGVDIRDVVHLLHNTKNHKGLDFLTQNSYILSIQPILLSELFQVPVAQGNHLSMFLKLKYVQLVQLGR